MYLVIMAGGSGTRFWPASRNKKPKQFLNIVGDDPMLLETCNRLEPLAKDEEMIVVLGREHLKDAKELFMNRKVRILAEPVGRNTAPCIGLGAIYAQYLGCNEPVAFLPADHFIGNNSEFVACLREAGRIAELEGIVTLGIVPTKPETGYGYIKRSQIAYDSSEMSVYKVSKFVEKPGPKKALQYIRSGEYFWNAGIFVATPDTILKEIQENLPDLYEGLCLVKKTLGAESFELELEQVYGKLEPISFDYGIMERTKDSVFVVACDCGWSDVGSWASLYELKEQDHDKNQNFSEGESLLIDCKQSFISSRTGRLVACLGLDNCIVVDTPDALLVGDLKRSQEIRNIVDHLKKDRKDELL